MDESGEHRVQLVDGFRELTLETRDPAALAEFYARVFGLPLLARESDRIWMAVGERARLGLWRPGRKEFGDEGGAHVHFALGVSEGAIDRLAERARRQGADVNGPLAHDGGDRSVYITDPEGNVVEAWCFFQGERTVESLAEERADEILAEEPAATESLAEEPGADESLAKERAADAVG